MGLTNNTKCKLTVEDYDAISRALADYVFHNNPDDYEHYKKVWDKIQHLTSKQVEWEEA